MWVLLTLQILTEKSFRIVDEVWSLTSGFENLCIYAKVYPMITKLRYCSIQVKARKPPLRP
jgi:hypothetical protein